MPAHGMREDENEAKEGEITIGLLNRKNKKSKTETKEGGFTATAVKTATAHPFSRLNSGVSLGKNYYLYSSLKQNVPIISAAITKITRLVGGFSFVTNSEKLNREMNTFFSTVPVGGNQWGIDAFVATYLEELLTYGSAVGEIIADDRHFWALYNGELNALGAKRAENGFNIVFLNGNREIDRQDLILFSALNPEPGQIMGNSVLSGLPFIADTLLKIYNTIGENWQHAGNVRYAVTYNPTGEIDGNVAKARASEIATAWSDAMQSTDEVKDFVAVGDVSIKVIGADNVVLDSEVPVRELLEQIIAKLGIPPYMLGLTWSTTERMSAQQADILTTELEHYRRVLTPVLKRIGQKYLDVNDYNTTLQVEWNNITLQDELELAEARLYNAEAEEIEQALGNAENDGSKQ